MIVIGEEGTPVTGAWVEVDKGAPMVENEIYEFYYDVYTLGERWPLNKIQSFVLSKFTDLVASFRGLEVIYWKLTDESLLWQGRGLSTSTWKEVALATVAIAAQGLLLAVGVIIALRAVFRSIPPPLPSPKKWWWAYLLGGLGLLALIFGIGYVKGRAK